ncbi:MAG: hypothetical protein HOH81_09360 [Flavobacteriaceae bacterium]|nr:hypothetical protein [Flavobacteriaceae bacterium]
MNTKFTYVLVITFLLTGLGLSAQAKLGDNPTDVNPNVLLELESSDKGLLIPRLTDAQRDSAFTSNVPEGLLIYNTTADCLQLYSSNSWNCIGGTTGALTLEGNVLSLNGNPLDLSDLLSNETLSLDAGDATTSVIRLGTSSITLKEGRNITLTESGNTITIAVACGGGGGGGAAGTDDQKLSLSGNVLTLEDGGSVTLPGGVNTDNQTLNVSGTTLSISGGNSVALASGTDTQTLSVMAGTTSQSILSLTNGGQAIFESGANIVLNEDPLTNTIYIAATGSLTAGTDDQNLMVGAGTASTSLIDIETGSGITLEAGNNITLSEPNASTIKIEATEQQTLTLTGTDLFISGTNSVSLAAFNNSSTDSQSITGLNLDSSNVLTIGITGGASDTVDLSALATSSTDSQSLTLVAGTSTATTLTLDNSPSLSIITSGTLTLNTTNSSTLELIGDTSGYLDKITENGKTGYRILNRNPDFYGDIGLEAVDLSFSNTVTNTFGATGDYSFTTGINNIASGDYSTSMGISSTASGVASFAVGHGASAKGHLSIAMGEETIASGYASVAMGFQTKANGDESFATGRFNYADGDASTAMGSDTKALGNISTSMGSLTEALGFASTAMGESSVANGNVSTAMGYETTAESFAETVIGGYNTNYTAASSSTWIGTDRLFVIGNGTSGSLSDALIMLKNGNTGLGVSSPTATLHVSGTLRIMDGLQGLGKVLTSDANGNAAWASLSAASATPTTLADVDGDTSISVDNGTDPDTISFTTSGTEHFRMEGYRLEVYNSNRNLAIGDNALEVNSTGYDNIGIGFRTLKSNTTGYYNTALGNHALDANVDAWNNSAFGFQALTENISGIANNAFGHQALYNSKNSYNSAFGGGALSSLTSGAQNTAVGHAALGYSLGDQNTAVGAWSLFWNNTTGSYNTALGYAAGNELRTNSSYNTFIGHEANTISTTILYNATAIGAGALVFDSNTIQLGNSSVTQVNSFGDFSKSGTNYNHPDYVFEKVFDGYSEYNSSYELMPLNQLELYIQKNKHLPGVQSRAEIQAKNSWNVSENVRTNLEKIEELYIHTIEQQKQIEAQQKEITALKDMLSTLLKKME